ncbi:MAG: class IIb bacteriocin, lactobin A/cerein 7B family [Desulfovermiculus sp.]
MALEDVKKFYELIAEDEKLKKQIMDLSSQYSHQELDETQRKEYVEKYVLPIAQEYGYKLTFNDMNEFEAQVNAVIQGEELNESEMESIAGGSVHAAIGSLCFGVGAWAGVIAGAKVCFGFGN